MPAIPILLGAAVYTGFAFPWAVVWHIALFRPFYEAAGHFGEAPNFALGFASIALQGLALSAFARHVSMRGCALARGLKCAYAAGAFFWTCHVLAAAAKEPLLADWRFFLLETPYLAVQFGVYGLAVGWIQRMPKPAASG